MSSDYRNVVVCSNAVKSVISLSVLAWGLLRAGVDAEITQFAVRE